MPTSDSLQRWFRAHYPPHREALASQLRREADVKARAGFADFLRALQAIQHALHSPAVIERIDTLRAAAERGATYVLATRQALVGSLEACLAGAERPRLIATA